MGRNLGEISQDIKYNPIIDDSKVNNNPDSKFGEALEAMQQIKEICDKYKNCPHDILLKFEFFDRTIFSCPICGETKTFFGPYEKGFEDSSNILDIPTEVTDKVGYQKTIKIVQQLLVEAAEIDSDMSIDEYTRTLKSIDLTKYLIGLENIKN